MSGAIDAGPCVLMRTRISACQSERHLQLCVGSMAPAHDHIGHTSGSQMRWAKIIVESELTVEGEEGER